MDTTMFKMLQTVLGGLGIFLLGMRFMSDGMQALAGSKLTKLVSVATGTRFRAIMVGTVVTFLLQSSSASTVMVVGFVNSGIMTLMQAIGVIFGANIGTTVTLWSLALPIADYGAMIIGMAVFFYIFAKKDVVRHSAMAVMGLGMLFFGMELMSNGFNPLRDDPEIRSAIARFDATSLFGFMQAVIASTVITAVLQSSAAVIGITIGLAVAGLVDFPTSVAVIMGSNIGTCGTAVIACIGTSRNAVRAALAHMMFNILGVVIAIAIHGPFVDFSERAVRWITQNPSDGLNYTLAIAWTHTAFNILSTVVMYPFMGWLERLVTFMLPFRKEEEKTKQYKPQYLDRNLLNQATIALDQAKKEIAVMGDTCLQMLEDLHTIIGSGERNEFMEEGIFTAENNLDVAQKEIAEYVTSILQGNVTHATGTEARRLIKQADEFESVSDHARNVLKAFLKIRNAGETLTDEATAEEQDLCIKVKAYCVDVMDIVAKGDKNRVDWARERSREIDANAKQYRDCHMQRLAVSCLSPVKSLVYSDMLNGFRRANDHLLNVAETLVD